MIAVLADRFKTRPRDEWCTRLHAEDVPNSPMYDTSEALDDPQARHLQLTTSAQHPVMGLFRTVRSPVSYRRRARARGACAADARRAQRRDPRRDPCAQGRGVDVSQRRSVLLAVAFAGCAVAIPASAQDSGTIRMVVPFGPGTTTDSVGRVVADGWARR